MLHIIEVSQVHKDPSRIPSKEIPHMDHRGPDFDERDSVKLL